MQKIILAAVDLAHIQQQKNVLGRTKELAELEKAKIAVISVIPDFGMSVVSSFFDEDTQKKALQRAKLQLHQTVKEILQNSSDIKHIIRQGNAYEEILKTIEELNIYLVVMGAHRPNYRDYLLGPNAARVVRHSKCSVYVVRD